jgi:hypothetical protein
MKRFAFAALLLIASPVHAQPPSQSFPVVYGYHVTSVDPRGNVTWGWYPVTPADAPSGWVRDPATGQRVWWRWERGRVVIWRTQ